MSAPRASCASEPRETHPNAQARWGPRRSGDHGAEVRLYFCALLEARSTVLGRAEVE